MFESVDLSAHILLLGSPNSQESLISLLAALRSKQLQSYRPIVIIDSERPCCGGTWETVAKFRDVYFIEVRLVGFTSCREPFPSALEANRDRTLAPVAITRRFPASFTAITTACRVCFCVHRSRMV